MYTPLYIGTGALLLTSLVFIFGVIRISSIRTIMENRDRHYLNRLDNIELMVKKDLKNITELLKKNLT